ncbi:MAG: hypothetical protein E6H97_00690 [Chloroflexi bacterium]|nr:MAG: hypothetical protein E6H97_00690 [Chloroflexota bacterium]
MTSVVVIGGGIAGYCAALGARREGAEVTVVAKAPGATALYAGAMEVVDDLEALLKNEPHHPLPPANGPGAIEHRAGHRDPGPAARSRKRRVEGRGRMARTRLLRRHTRARAPGQRRSGHCRRRGAEGSGWPPGHCRRRARGGGLRRRIDGAGSQGAAQRGGDAGRGFHHRAAGRGGAHRPLRTPRACTDKHPGTGRVSARAHQPARRRLRAARLTAVSTRMAAAAGDRPGRGARRGGWRAGRWGADRRREGG